MSINICTLRNTSGTLLQKWDNYTTTPPMYRSASQPTWYAYPSTSASPAYWCDNGSNIGNPANLSISSTPRDTYASKDPYASKNGKFTLETGYEAVVTKSIPASDVTVSIRSGSSGTSSLKSVFFAGESAYFHAVNVSKYRFLSWSVGGSTVSTNAVYQRTMNADVSVMMVSEQYKWTLATQSSNPTVGETTIVGGSASGDYENGTVKNITATVKTAYTADYKFKHWTLDDVVVGTSATLQVTTGEEDVTYVAVFVAVSYTLDVTPQNAAHGSVSVDGQVTTTGLEIVSLSQVTVRATPAFGYTFLGWYVGGVSQSSAAVYSFTMPEADLAMEARFVALTTAPITITKTKGPVGSLAAKDMGSVAQYHLDTILDTTSGVGTATLASNLYTTKVYKFVPTPVDATHQFEGWFQTVDNAEVPITTGGIFTVEGNNLFVTPTTADPILVNAQFDERSYCTIAPVASDSSTYVSPNPAETAGCTCFVTTLPPDDDDNSNGQHDTGDRWLSGQTITVEARQAAGWELQLWVVKMASAPYTTLYSLAKGEDGFGQVYSFNLLQNVQVVAVSEYTLPADLVQIQALLKSGQPLTSGKVEIHPCGDNYVENENGSVANVDDGGPCELIAIPANGYRFLQWREGTEDGAIVSYLPIYNFTVNGSATYFAEFEATGFDSLVLFEGSADNRIAQWRGKTYVSNMPVNFSCAKVYADGYPVALDVGTAQSPSTPHLEENVVRSLASEQDPFRLPSRRREKYAMVGVETTFPVSAFAVSTSMEDLKNG